MIVTVLLFARWREVLGTSHLAVELPTPTVAALRGELARQQPNLTDLLARTAIAVNNDVADDARLLQSTDEIALLPPVSGGAPLRHLRLLIP